MFADPTFIMFGKLLLAALLGVLIGTERAVVARRPAGMRTFALVSLGACIFGMMSLSLGQHYFDFGGFDPTRMISVTLQGIIQGVGFIGAGLMFFQKDSVHGITTAAGLWVAAAVGALVAFDMYPLAIFASALTVAIFFGLWYVEHRFIRWYHDSFEGE